MGPQRTAIILASAPGVGVHPYANKTNTASLFFSSTSQQTARAFYLEASYGQTSVVGAWGAVGSASDVYGPYTLSTASCSTGTIGNEALAAADAELDYNAYDRIVIAWHYSPCGNGGVATIRAQSQGTRDGATQYLSISWDFNADRGRHDD